jgi:hypothetical protein
MRDIERLADIAMITFIFTASPSLLLMAVSIFIGATNCGG